MTSFVRPGAFAAVIVPAGSIGLDGSDALRQALGCFRESLMPSGRLILDVDMPYVPDGPGPMGH
ncbi:MAG: class I SAM-dependent methyltransferase, partial [Actinomycetota bacterium]